MMINKNIRPGEGLADPHALVVGDRVYIFCGSDKSHKTEDTWRMDKWKIYSSDNLVDWKDEGEILPTDTYIGDLDHCWAGYITERNGKYYFYFSNKFMDTGVVVSNSITGPFVDVKKAPVIPQDTLESRRCYDPCVFEENGVYTIFFGAGIYYCATLSEDMLSIVDKPQMIMVTDENDNQIRCSDKCTFFKHNGIYYLAYGTQYAMSDKLKGPYKFAGRFSGGGHNDVFEFKGKMYVCNEFHDTNIFFRGIRVMELNFDANGKVVLADDDELDIHYKKTWDFSDNDFHWFKSDMSDAKWDNGLICGADGTQVRSPLWPGVYLEKDEMLKIEIENQSDTDEFTVEIITIDEVKGYWNSEDHQYHKFTVKFEDGKNLYQVPIKANGTIKTFIKKITIYSEKENARGFYRIKKVEI